MSVKSHYGNYIRERLGKDIIEDEYGFATFYFIGDGCYIEDIYVDADHRKGGHASKYADQIAAKAKELGYTKLYGTVVPTAKGSTESLKVLLAYGFRVDSAANNVIALVKVL